MAMAMEGAVMPPEVEEALISQFIEIASGQTTATARRYLESSSWDPEQALQLFFAVGTESANWDNDYAWLDYEDPQRQGSSDVWAERESNDNYSPKINYSWDKIETPNAAADGDNDHQGNDLPSLFRPPSDLLFKGDFEQSKDVAKEQNRWLLVNVQSIEEFNSHRLNRDTWADETVAGIVGANFIFWQVYNDTDMGMKVCSYYRITDSFPVIMVIDPITGQKMASWTGMIHPEDFLGKLSRFMDTNPRDHILSLCNKRPHETLVDERCLETVEEEKASKMMPVYPPLPEEPKCDRSLLCKVGIRLPPDGRRIQRSFLLADPIQLLWSFCMSELREEERRRPFQLIQGMPGSSKHLDYDSTLTFKESGLANSIISISLE